MSYVLVFCLVTSCHEYEFETKFQCQMGMQHLYMEYNVRERDVMCITKDDWDKLNEAYE